MYRLFVLFALLTVSCSKDDSSTDPNWTVDGKTFVPKVFLLTSVTSRWYDVTDPNTNAPYNYITIEFSSNMPQVAGVYDIGGSGTGNFIRAMNAVTGVNSTTANGYVFSSNTKIGTATVTVNNGRRFISFSNVTVQKSNSTGQIIGSATLSANYLEY